ncbi:MAG: NAD-glutamate dehydrogenase [Rhodospirillales bacterium]|nr:NAD-glutamate dehydrogenase [Rhodospirillales bacterium]
MAITDAKSSELIRKIVNEAKKIQDKTSPLEVQTFIQHYFATSPAHDLAGNKPAELAALAMHHFGLGKTRVTGMALVRVFNPTLKTDGYDSDHTIIEICNDDMPFLVDSIASEITRQELDIHLLIHPILKLRRTNAGKFTEFVEAGTTGAIHESFIRLEITRQSGRRLDEIKQRFDQILSDIRCAVEDWQPMRDRMGAIIEEFLSPPKGMPTDEVSEARDFMRWIHDNNFTFLGYREYDLKGDLRKTKAVLKKQSGLGVLRDASAEVFDEIDSSQALHMEVRAFVRNPSMLLVTKSNLRSSIHRPVHMDALSIKRYDANGRVVGQRIFVGLFTSGAYNKAPSEIPLLRRRVQMTMDRSGFSANSHDGKALMNILDTFPRDELFQISDDQLFETATGILHLQERHRTALFIRPDELGRYCSCLVFVPRDRYTTELRQHIQEILAEELDGRIAAFFTQLGESALARCHIIVPMLHGKIPRYNISKIEKRLVQAARSWADHLEDAVTADLGEEKSLDLVSRWGHAFDPDYEHRYRPDEVIRDIEILETVIRSGDIGMNLFRTDGAPDHKVRFKIYQKDEPIALSDVLPIFENLGFKVIDEAGPHRIQLPDQALVIHNFGLETRDGSAVQLNAMRDNFHATFAKVWIGAIESDGFNALVTRTGLAWREIVILRALCKYLRQTGITFSQQYMEQTLTNNPRIAADLVSLFLNQFDPKAGSQGAQKAKRLTTKIIKALEEVASADEDRILRRYLNLLQSMLRTNFFQTDASGNEKSYVSFKFNARLLDDLPLPKPLREIFVYSPRVEGIHLRFGLVARGGLRWSDRREDFRTEILGLVKAQQVKNAVIVPVGSKGGFVCKQPPRDNSRQAFMDEGIACYKILIAGLLDLTDNIKGLKVVPPVNVVRLDDDDPYLVVAADKGTATFSDIANGVSIEYGHWLGDAFASGGSQGYDHKKMGITARGGWESVKRHFREMGMDIQNEDFTVVGVGDMQGDVFGNGMLLSKHIRLLAAFNHLHIFVDPDPDAAKSWVERKRLFDTPGLAWSDYDSKLLSAGGMIYERSAKSLKLTPQIQSCLGITKATATPNELMEAILRAKADLLWFGGIGTYIKSLGQSHLDAGDRANDGIRINGRDVRCKVIGEGANLGCTQPGRIEYAEHGGALNTDSIDNSAGVDSSDHEVNIKILVDSVMLEGSLNQSQRNALLASMTDEVGNLVLVHNYRQTQALSFTQAKGVGALDNQQRLMKMLEREDRLNRTVEYLPDDETIAERHLAHTGLYRPELSVLISYAKIWLYDQMIASDMPDDSYLEQDLVDYFPTPLRQIYRKFICKHRLRREIIATRATNSLVDRAGDTFVTEFMEKTGKSPAAISRAYIIAREVFQLREMWAAIEALDTKVPTATQTAMMMDIHHLLDWVVLWFLRNGKSGLDMGTHINEFKKGIAELSRDISKAIPPHYLSDARKRAQPYIDKGVPEVLALKIAGLVNLYSGLDVVRLATRRKCPVLDGARIYFAVGTRFKLGRLRAATDSMGTENHW